MHSIHLLVTGLKVGRLVFRNLQDILGLRPAASWFKKCVDSVVLFLGEGVAILALCLLNLDLKSLASPTYKAVQNTFSCAFPIFRDLFQKLWICLGIEFFLGRCNLRRPRTIPFLGVRKYAGTQDKIPSWAP